MIQENDIIPALETMVDNHGMIHVLTALETICREKAKHTRTNWQDTDTAHAWDVDANGLYRLAVVFQKRDRF